MPYTPLIPKGSAPPLAPYSPGAKAGNTIYVSGTLAIDKDGKTVGAGDVKAQTRFILESIKSVRNGCRTSTSSRSIRSI